MAAFEKKTNLFAISLAYVKKLLYLCIAIRKLATVPAKNTIGNEAYDDISAFYLRPHIRDRGECAIKTESLCGFVFLLLDHL